MKFLTGAALALASLAIATPVDVNERTIEKRANPSVSGLDFQINGVTQYFAGTNAYWISFLTNNADVDLVMSHLVSSGLKVLRVWGFNDINAATNQVWFQSLIPGQAPVINTGPNGLQRLDYVVSSAEAHGIKLIINFVNNWSDFGGMPAYNNYFGTGADPTLWYTNTAVQAQYKAYITAVVNRYKTSDAIFAWELANEPRCHACATSVVTEWATTISAFIKSLDSTHMVTLGDEGFTNGGGDGSYPYTTEEGIDFAQNLKIKTLDFGTFHMYPESWGEPDEPFGTQWPQVHGALCVAANKPCILEEYGTPANHATVEAPWQSAALGAKGVAGDMFWQYGDTLSTGQTSNDGNTIYFGTSDYTVLVTDHVDAIEGKTPPPTPTTSASGPSGTGTVPEFGQCGGENWTGATACVSPFTCVVQNPFFSQCV